MKISLDSSVRHINRVAAMALSGTIQNGLMLTQNPNAPIIIYKDKIDFGKSLDPNLQRMSGMILPNFYMEYGKVIYRFGNNLKCSFWTKTIEYVGFFKPSTPDNQEIFNEIYPHFS